VTLTLALVLTANVSLQAVARVMRILQPLFAETFGTPHWTTGRWWLLRVGYYAVCRPKEMVTDRVWIVDHSTQSGQERCLLILGIRLCDLPPVGKSLSLSDMEVIDLVPVVKSDKRVVFEQLTAAAEKTGVPRAIVHDCGGDLAGGLALYQEKHPETAGIYDITHKVACLLKARLENDPTWKAFCAQMAQARFQTQQTELAFLVPPTPRNKARFMNLEVVIRWGRETLTMIERPPTEVLRHITLERLEEKFGWLRKYKEPLREWSQMQNVIDVTVDFVRCNGHYCDSAKNLRRSLEPLVLDAPAQTLRDELVTFVEEQSQQAKEGERLPGSSEVLESAFGKFKQIEGNQSKGGFTGLLLALPAILGGLSVDRIRAALEFAKTEDVIQWIRKRLGQSHQSKRCMAYSAVSGPKKELMLPSPARSATSGADDTETPEPKKLCCGKVAPGAG